MEHSQTSAAVEADPRIAALPDIHGHAKGEHKAFAEERPIPYTARMLFLWFFHACRRSSPRFLMVADHMNYLTFEDPAAVNLVRRALKLAQAGDLYGAAETAGVELGHAAVVSEGLRRGMRYSIGAEIDNDPRCRPDAQNIVDAMKPDGMIRSIHFLSITHPQHGEHWMWAFDNPEFNDLYDVVGPANVWEIYMATLLDAIDKLPGNIVGHFYVPAKFGHWPEDDVLASYEDRFVAACAERGMAIEVNSRYFYKYYVGDDAQLARYRSAHLRLLRKAKAAGVMVAVGSDAHSPKDQGNAFDSVLALLDEAEINEIAFPIGGRLARVALRATEEILREHNAAIAPPVAASAPQVDDSPVEEESTSNPDPSATPAEPPKSASRPTRSRAKAPVAEAETAEAETAEAETAEVLTTEAVAAKSGGTDAEATTHDAAVATTLDAERAEPPVVAKKRSHKKASGANVALDAIGAVKDVVSAVAAKAAAAVTSALTQHDAKADEAVPPEAKPDDAKPDDAIPDEAERQEAAPHEAPAGEPLVTKPLIKAARAEASGAERSGRAASVRVEKPVRATAAKTPHAAVTKPKAKAPSKPTATRSAPVRKSSAKSAKPVARAASTAKSPPRTKAAAVKKSAKKTVAKAPSHGSTIKKSSAKPAARAAKKSPAKRSAPAKKATAKVTKRSAPAKAVTGKKGAAKKSVAKKKTSRSRR